MLRVMNALQALMAANATMQTFIGIGGPFLSLPQPYPALPYTMLTQVGGTPNWQSFQGIYVARSQIRITLWDRDQQQNWTNGEFVASVLDVQSSWTLGGSDECRLPIRIEEPRYLEMSPDKNGMKVFGCVLDYRFNVQRTRGVA